LLRGIDIVSETDVWAVGSTDTLQSGEWRILHYTGGSWQVVDMSNPDGVNVNPRYSVAMTNPNNGWAVGRYTYMLHYENGSWTPQEEGMEPGGGPPEIRYAVEMVSDTQGWLAGVYYDWDLQQGMVPSGLVRQYMSGSWDNRVEPETDKVFYDIAAIEATGGTGYELWIVGEAGTIYHFFPGGGWQQVDPSPTTADLWSIALVSATEAWAVGDNGTILHYAGGAWQTSPSLTTNNLRALAMVSASEGWAVGENGTILHYTGSTWQDVGSPTTEHLYDVAVLPSGEGWAVGDKGTILYHMAPPTAAFTATPTVGLKPLDVQFTDASSGTITSRLWSFGDGVTSTEQSPTHTYTSGGSYVSQLTVSNAGGSSTAGQTITVGD